MKHCFSVNLDNLPKFGTEEFNMHTVVDKQVRTEAAIKQLSAVQAGSSVHTTATSVDASTVSCHEMVKSMADDMQVKMETFSASINARLDQLNSVCKSSLGTVHARDITSQSHVDVDRKLNIVVFGVNEDQDP